MRRDLRRVDLVGVPEGVSGNELRDVTLRDILERRWLHGLFGSLGPVPSYSYETILVFYFETNEHRFETSHNYSDGIWVEKGDRRRSMAFP